MIHEALKYMEHLSTHWFKKYMLKAIKQKKNNYFKYVHDKQTQTCVNEKIANSLLKEFYCSSIILINLVSYVYWTEYVKTS